MKRSLSFCLYILVIPYFSSDTYTTSLSLKNPERYPKSHEKVKRFHL